MLPVLFTISLSPAWAPIVAAAVALIVGAWQARGARVAGAPWKKAFETAAVWTGGTALVLYLAVRMLGERVRHLERRPRLLRRLHRRGARVSLVHAQAPHVVLPVRGRDHPVGRHRPRHWTAWMLRGGLLLGRGMRPPSALGGAVSTGLACVPESGRQPPDPAGCAAQHSHPPDAALRVAGRAMHLRRAVALGDAQAVPRRAAGAVSHPVRTSSRDHRDDARRRGARPRLQLHRSDGTRSE